MICWRCTRLWRLLRSARMGKRHNRRKPHPASAPVPVSSAGNTSTRPPSGSFPTPASAVRRIGLQFAALLSLSAVLGFTFNAANPIGVRFGKATVTAPPATSLTNFALSSSASLVAAAATVAPEPAALPTPQPTQRPIPRPPSPQLPTTAVTHVSVPTVAPPPARPATNPVPLAVASTAQTNLNPAPIHWREAKLLVASGQALLVDVRPAPVYDAGHIPDAISLPESSSAEIVNAFLKQVPTNLTLIVYCSSTSCSQSKRVADRLVGMHKWASVKYMTGGYLEYQQEELAKRQEPANPQPPAVR